MNDQTGHGRQSEQDGLLQKNQDYYRRQFGKFNVAGKDRFKLTWNWAAFLLPYVWPAYRRMYGWTLVGPFLFVIAVYFMLAIGWSPKLLVTGHILLSLVFGATGNYLYYQKIQSALSSSSDKCGTTISGAIAAPLVFWVGVALYFGITLPGYLSYRDKSYEFSARADLVNARTMLNAIYNDNGSYKAAALVSSSGVTTLVCSTGRSYSRRLSSQGVELKLLAAEKDCYVVTSQHEKGRNIYLAIDYETGHPGYSGLAREIVNVQLPGTMNKIAAIFPLVQGDIEKLSENDARAYRTAQDAQRIVLQIARKERGAYVDKETFRDLVRESGITIIVPNKNEIAAGSTLFTRHENGEMIFFSCGCSDKVYGIQVNADAGSVRVEEQ